MSINRYFKGMGAGLVLAGATISGVANNARAVPIADVQIDSAIGILILFMMDLKIE